MSKRKPLPLPREDPRWVPVIELHARLAKQLGSVVEADQYLTVEFRKEPLEGIRTMRDPPERPGGRDVPEEDLSLIEWLDRDAERDLPEAGVLLHGWFRGWEILSFTGVVCAYPLYQPLKLIELCDIYAWLPDCRIKDLPTDLSPFAPSEPIPAFELPTSDNLELAAAIDRLPAKIADVLKRSYEAAAAARKELDNNEDAPDSLQRQIAWAIIGRVYPNVAVTDLPDTADVRRTVRRGWEAELRACGMNANPTNPDPKKKKYVKPPSYQTVRRMLGRDPKHK